MTFFASYLCSLLSVSFFSCVLKKGATRACREFTSPPRGCWVTPPAYATAQEVLAFLDAADQYGESPATARPPLTDGASGEDDETPTISQEARILKRMFLRLR